MRGPLTIAPTATPAPQSPAPRPEGGARRFFARSAAVAAGLGPLLVLAAFIIISNDQNADAPTMILGGLGLLCLAYAIIVGPIARWGPSALFLTFGLVLLIGGVIGLIGVQTTASVVETTFQGDDDGDGVTDEDDFGDADGSATDPTQISGPAEALNPEDDDADGATDEDPAPVTTTRPEVRQAYFIGQQVALGVMAIGLVFVVLFFALQNMPDRRRVPVHGR